MEATIKSKPANKKNYNKTTSQPPHSEQLIVSQQFEKRDNGAYKGMVAKHITPERRYVSQYCRF